MSDLHRKRSVIWKHFTIVSENKAKCGYCNHSYSFLGGATSNLMRHLKTKYSTIPLETSTVNMTVQSNFIHTDQNATTSKHETVTVSLATDDDVNTTEMPRNIQRSQSDMTNFVRVIYDLWSE